MGNLPATIYATTTLGLILPPASVLPDCNCLVSLTRRQESQNIFQLSTNSPSIKQSTVAGINTVLGLVGETSGCCGATVPVYEHRRQYYNTKYKTYDYNTTQQQSPTPVDCNTPWTTSESPIFYIWPAALIHVLPKDSGCTNDAGCQSNTDPDHLTGLTSDFIRLQYRQNVQFFKLDSEPRWEGPFEAEPIHNQTTLGRIFPPGTVLPKCDDCLVSLIRNQEYMNIFPLSTKSSTIIQFAVAGIQGVLGHVGKTSGCCGATVPIYEHRRQYRAIDGHMTSYKTYDYNTAHSPSSMPIDEEAPWATSADPIFYIWPAA